ncbi:radical SAM protein [Candidatus Bathyarchaeota archaeon]|nr:radical SAM protein [Candidatus Bathyarchaeota archaeon]
MTQLSPQTLWTSNSDRIQKILDQGLLLSRFKKIHFYVPSFMYSETSHYSPSPTDFPTISITGSVCALKCKHCGGKVLNTMYSATTPSELLNLCRKLKKKGALGCLISGGCKPDGSVPLSRLISAIEKIKRDTDLTMIVHTGILDLNTAKKLKTAGVDAALIDIIGSDETIKEIYNLDTTVQAYEDSLKALHQTGIPYIPHVIVGLHYGKLKGERNALKIISRYRPSALVVIAFMPIHGTDMEKTAPPRPIDIARTIATARLMFPKTPIALGCMRPKGRHRAQTDVLAIKAGIDALAFPGEESIAYARELDYDIKFSSLCCSQVYTDLKNLNT